MVRNLHICSLVALFLCLSCGRGVEEGTVGQAYTLTAETPEEGQDLDFIWELSAQPEASTLSHGDLIFDEDQNTMTFTPDAAGPYEFEVTVYHFNDELSTQSFRWEIKPPEDEPVREVPQVGPPPTEAWYEEEEATLELGLDEETPAAIDTAAAAVPAPAPEPGPPPPVMEPEPAPAAPSKPRPRSAIPYDRTRFTIQVASKRDINAAETVASGLIEAGYDAYIQKAYLEEINQVWFRIRVGSYGKIETARAVAESIASLRQEPTWVDYVRYE